jgi:hypothetical protein
MASGDLKWTNETLMVLSHFVSLATNIIVLIYIQKLLKIKEMTIALTLQMWMEVSDQDTNIPDAIQLCYYSTNTNPDVS